MVHLLLIGLTQIQLGSFRLLFSYINAICFSDFVFLSHTECLYYIFNNLSFVLYCYRCLCLVNTPQKFSFESFICIFSSCFLIQCICILSPWFVSLYVYFSSLPHVTSNFIVSSWSCQKAHLPLPCTIRVFLILIQAYTYFM